MTEYRLRLSFRDDNTKKTVYYDMHLRVYQNTAKLIGEKGKENLNRTDLKFVRSSLEKTPKGLEFKASEPTGIGIIPLGKEIDLETLEVPKGIWF